MKNWKMFDLKKHSDIHVMCLLGRLKYSKLERLIESHKNKTHAATLVETAQQNKGKYQKS